MASLTIMLDRHSRREKCSRCSGCSGCSGGTIDAEGKRRYKVRLGKHVTLVTHFLRHFNDLCLEFIFPLDYYRLCVEK